MSKRLLAKGSEVDNNTRNTGLNNNDLIIGPSGAGKTRGYVIPNLLRIEDSFIVSDTKKNLIKKFGPTLKEKGFKVISIDFTDLKNSDYGFNPLYYLDPSHEQDIFRVTENLVHERE